jgi:hypothetical protein
VAVALIQAVHLTDTAQTVVQAAAVEQPKALTMLVVQLLLQVKVMPVEQDLETFRGKVFMRQAAVVVQGQQEQTQPQMLVEQVELDHLLTHLGV